jgi:hydroxypyruvate isomerase
MPRFAANLSMMFTERPFLERFDAAAAAGFGAVEFLFPYSHPAAGIRAVLDRSGLELALFNTPPGDWEAGERGLAALPGREAAFRDSIALALDYAAVLRPHRLHVMAGLAEGAAARAVYLANLAQATEMADDRQLCIEPINSRDMPGYHLNNSTDAVAVLDAVGVLMARIVHIQIAGVPERHEPDIGEVDFGHLFGVLNGLGYEGFVGCEYRPKGQTEDGLGWLGRLGG